MVAAARVHGHAGISVCDRNSLAGVVRAHVAFKGIGLRHAVGTRLVLTDGVAYLAWPTDRDSYGRLTRLLSLGRMRAPKGACGTGRDDLIGYAEGWVMAAIPPGLPDAAFAARLRADAAALGCKLPLPPLCCSIVFDGADRHRLDRLAGMAGKAGAGGCERFQLGRYAGARPVQRGGACT